MEWTLTEEFYNAMITKWQLQDTEQTRKMILDIFSQGANDGQIAYQKLRTGDFSVKPSHDR